MVASFWLGAATARAEPSPSTAVAPTGAVGVSLGAGTPMGTIGIFGELTPRPWGTLGLGVGMSGQRPQVALMSRLLVPILPGDPQVVLSFGLGLSAGPYEWTWCGLGCEAHHVPHDKYAMMLWGNAEAGLELRVPRGMQFRFFGGVAEHIAGWGKACVPTTIGPGAGQPCAAADDRIVPLPYGGIAVAHAFDL